MEDETKQTSIQLDPKAAREGANLSEDEMADLIDMSVHGYRLWENGQRQPGGAAFKLLGLMTQDTAEIVRRLRAIENYISSLSSRGSAQRTRGCGRKPPALVTACRWHPSSLLA